MKLGMVGLPNVGKSTLFNALTKSHAECGNYHFCTIEPNVGFVAVPDERLNKLAEIYDPVKITPAVIEFVDIAGLIRGSAKGEGLGNKFLSNIRDVDAIIHVVRCFDNDDILHVDNSVDSSRDIETINLELILSDMEMIERRLDKAKKLVKGDKKIQDEIDLYERLIEAFNSGISARSLEFNEAELFIVRQAALLSMKPILYVANVSEDDMVCPDNSSYVLKVKNIAKEEGSEVITVCVKIEEELARLNDSDKEEFLAAMDLTDSGLDQLIRAGYKLLGLISFLTAGKPEVRAWTIRNGSKAPQAAGKIHSDLERGFIRAEIVAFDDLAVHGSMAAAKDKGLVRLEGKDYVMKDGDVTLIRFNV